MFLAVSGGHEWMRISMDDLHGMPAVRWCLLWAVGLGCITSERKIWNASRWETNVWMTWTVIRGIWVVFDVSSSSWMNSVVQLESEWTSDYFSLDEIMMNRGMGWSDGAGWTTLAAITMDELWMNVLTDEYRWGFSDDGCVVERGFHAGIIGPVELAGNKWPLKARKAIYSFLAAVTRKRPFWAFSIPADPLDDGFRLHLVAGCAFLSSPKSKKVAGAMNTLMIDHWLSGGKQGPILSFMTYINILQEGECSGFI